SVTRANPQDVGACGTTVTCQDRDGDGYGNPGAACARPGPPPTATTTTRASIPEGATSATGWTTIATAGLTTMPFAARSTSTAMAACRERSWPGSAAPSACAR